MIAVVRRAATWHRPLLVLTCLTLVTAVGSAAGLVLDDRVLTGEPIWLKPFKFSVSIALYAITWAWLLAQQRRPRRWMDWTATAIAGLLVVEMVIIVGQVVRGRASHFNVETALDSRLFTIMGYAIGTVWVLGMVQGFVLLRERLADPAMTWAIRLGIVLGTIGIGLAFLMVGPTSEQLAAAHAGADLTRVGAHTVGLADGGPGMPITGWSTVGGDLRIPHFVGIHAMQALPLFVLLLGRRLADSARVRLVIIAGGAYAGVLAVVTWQALRGQSLIHPDSWTLLGYGVVLAGAAVALGRAFAREPEVVR